MTSCQRARPAPCHANVVDGAPDLLRLGLTEGILPAEGAQALRRILAADVGSRVVASSTRSARADRPDRCERATSPGDGSDGSKQARGESARAFVAPRNDVERTLATFWQELMGLDRVGIDDDFFELGGYSLIAVRLFAKIKKAFGVDLSLDTLFQASTIARCAAIIADELGIELESTGPLRRPHHDERHQQPTNGTGGARARTPSDRAGVLPSSRTARHAGDERDVRSRRASAWSPLVAIQPNGDKLPFFCVHGAGGNVLVFRDLSRRLGPDQPFYGLQAQGVDGKLPPLERIEDMASQYLEASARCSRRGRTSWAATRAAAWSRSRWRSSSCATGEEVASWRSWTPSTPVPPFAATRIAADLRKLVERGPLVRDGPGGWLWDMHIRDG